MDSKIIIFFFVLFALSVSAFAQQRQLVALKDEQVLARYQKGDVIKFMRAKDKELQVQRILDLNDTLLMMNFDSVAYYRIKKLDIKAKQGSTFAQRLGSTLIIAGLVLPLADLFNTAVIQDQDPSVGEGVWIASAAMVGTGAALVFIKKPYFEPGRHYHLMIIDERSPFYKERIVNDGTDILNIQK